MERSRKQILAEVYEAHQDIMKKNVTSVNNSYLKLREIFTLKDALPVMTEKTAEECLIKIGVELDKNIESCKRLREKWEDSKNIFMKIIQQDGK